MNGDAKRTPPPSPLTAFLDEYRHRSTNDDIEDTGTRAVDDLMLDAVRLAAFATYVKKNPMKWGDFVIDLRAAGATDTDTDAVAAARARTNADVSRLERAVGGVKVPVPGAFEADVAKVRAYIEAGATDFRLDRAVPSLSFTWKADGTRHSTLFIKRDDANRDLVRSFGHTDLIAAKVLGNAKYAGIVMVALNEIARTAPVSIGEAQRLLITLLGMKVEYEQWGEKGNVMRRYTTLEERPELYAKEGVELRQRAGGWVLWVNLINASGHLDRLGNKEFGGRSLHKLGDILATFAGVESKNDREYDRGSRWWRINVSSLIREPAPAGTVP